MIRNRYYSYKQILFGTVVFLILFEYINSLLRYFGIIDMSLGVTIRKLVFILFLLITASPFLFKTSINMSIPKRMFSFLLMYMLFLMGYLINNERINISDISYMILPVIVGMLGFHSGLSIHPRQYRRYILLYVTAISLLYFGNVYHGKFQYVSVGLNSVFYLILMAPMLFFLENKLLRIIMITYMCILGLISLKATVVVILIGTIFLYYCLSGKNVKVKIVLLPLIGLIVLGMITLVVNEVFSVNLYEYYIRQNIRDGGNGRVGIWLNVLNRFKEGTASNILIGYGYDGVASHLISSSHNDFLEVLFDFGLTGLLIFCFNYFKLVMIGVKMYIDGYQYACIYLMILFELTMMFLLSNILFVSSYFLIIVVHLFALIRDYYEKEN